MITQIALLTPNATDVALHADLQESIELVRNGLLRTFLLSLVTFCYFF